MSTYLEKYPFTAVNETESFIDRAPKGWRYLLELMCEEIVAAPGYGGPDMEDFQIVMRVSTSCAPMFRYEHMAWSRSMPRVNQIINDICNKYDAASRHVCMLCGEAPVYIRRFYWKDYPMCSEHANSYSPDYNYLNIHYNKDIYRSDAWSTIKAEFVDYDFTELYAKLNEKKLGE